MLLWWTAIGNMKHLQYNAYWSVFVSAWLLDRFYNVLEEMLLNNRISPLYEAI